MASSSLACSTTSLSLTLPISCQICLGKVKEPVICPNQHVFCSTCMEVWLRSNQACPTCRTQITADRPCKKILGSLDLPVPSADHVTRTELRQTRLELIRQDFEDEIASLHKTVDRLQTENKQLYERLGEQDRQIAALELSAQQRKMKMVEGQGKTYPDMDILVKLTSKLQEASSTYEQLKDDMNKTREENQKLREENTNLLQENTRIKQESLFNRSPQKFGRYTVAALETKVSHYEREVQQLKKALVRSDHYIEELTRNEHNTSQFSASQNNRTNILANVTGTCTSSTPTLTACVDIPSSSFSIEMPSMSGLGNSVEVVSSQKIVKDEVPVLYCKNVATMETEDTVSCIKSLGGGRLNQPLPSSVCSSSSVTVASQNHNSFVRRQSETFSHSTQASMVPCYEISAMLNSPSFLPEKKESWLRSSPFNRSETASEGASAQGDLYPRVPLQDPASTPLIDPTTSKGPNEEDELKMFPASKQLRLLSERIKRQRGESAFPAKATKGTDHVELSPASSDGACVMRTLDFDSEAGSVNNLESPRQGSLLEDHLQSTTETSTPSDSFSFIKIKIEVPDRRESAENPGPLKKVKTEQSDSNMET